MPRPPSGVRGLSTAVLGLLLAACGSGDAAPAAGADPTPDCDGRCAETAAPLSVAEVERIIAQGVAEARARGVSGHLAVSDRVGNLLALFSMDGAPSTLRVATPGRRVETGLEGVTVIPAVASAVTKAVTGAYVSSEGQAFSTRTASQIIQEFFNPGERGQPGGPLFGVQFSQLPCSDFSARAGGAAVSPGPHRAPLGMSADPGGFPLYRNGTVVGGVGVEIDGAYGLDPNVFDLDAAVDEQVALAASFGFAAPADRRADRITVDGKTLRFSDAGREDLLTAGAPAALADALAVGQFVSLRGYTPGGVRAGTAFGQPASGVRAATEPVFRARDAFVLVDAANQNRFPPRAGAGADALSATDVRELLGAALDVANRARAQIRRPLGSAARVSVFVVGREGEVLGALRSRDAPVFGMDVALQKARSALFLSGAGAAAALQGLPPVGYLADGFNERPPLPIGDYVTAFRDFFGDGAALADGATAFATRSLGNLARPYFPDGLVGSAPGPASKPFADWSVFSTGLQLDLSHNALIKHTAFLLGAIAEDVEPNCTGIRALSEGLGVENPIPMLANGLQVFPGGVPIYRGEDLIGAIGVSGDGIEQDDMVAFLGVHQAGLARGGAIGNAPPSRRADRPEIQGQRLRYVQCPQSPFLDSDEEQVCAGK
jgi:uncharacterized protein GlcG (DUF336 family)